MERIKKRSRDEETSVSMVSTATYGQVCAAKLIHFMRPTNLRPFSLSLALMFHMCNPKGEKLRVKE